MKRFARWFDRIHPDDIVMAIIVLQVYKLILWLD
jgi:hypothetical protein